MPAEQTRPCPRPDRARPTSRRRSWPRFGSSWPDPGRLREPAAQNFRCIGVSANGSPRDKSVLGKGKTFVRDLLTFLGHIGDLLRVL